MNDAVKVGILHLAFNNEKTLELAFITPQVLRLIMDENFRGKTETQEKEATQFGLRMNPSKG